MENKMVVGVIRKLQERHRNPDLHGPTGIEIDDLCDTAIELYAEVERLKHELWIYVTRWESIRKSMVDIEKEFDVEMYEKKPTEWVCPSDDTIAVELHEEEK